MPKKNLICLTNVPLEIFPIDTFWRSFGKAFGVIILGLDGRNCRGVMNKPRFSPEFSGQLYISGFLDWIMLILVWLERSLFPAQVKWQRCHKWYKGCWSVWALMGSSGVNGLSQNFSISWFHRTTSFFSQFFKLPISDVWIVSYVLEFNPWCSKTKNIYIVYELTHAVLLPLISYSAQLHCTCVFLIHLHAVYHIPQSLEEQAPLQRNTLTLSMDSPTNFGDGVEKMMTSTTGTCICAITTVDFDFFVALLISPWLIYFVTWRWSELRKYKFLNEDMIVAVVIAI